MSPSFKARLILWREQLLRTPDRGVALLFRWVRARLSRSDVISVAVFPERLLISRVGGGWRRPVVQREVIAVAPGPAGVPVWQAALEALAAKVADGALSRAQVSVVLSSHFVHYAHVPWHELLNSEAEQLAYARQRFVQVHGEAARAWVLRISRAAPKQSRIACAIQPSLLAALDDALAPLGQRYVSLQPHLMTSFNHWRQRLGSQPCWLAVVEPGLLCLALLQDGQWQSVRSMKLGSNWPEQLPDLLAREHCLVDSRDDTGQVVVLADEVPAAAALKKGPWKVEDLKSLAPRSMSSRLAVALASAVGA